MAIPRRRSAVGAAVLAAAAVAVGFLATAHGDRFVYRPGYSADELATYEARLRAAAAPAPGLLRCAADWPVVVQVDPPLPVTAGDGAPAPPDVDRGDGA